MLDLTDAFKALSDVTRRELLTQLCQQGPCRVTDLASYYDMSLNGVSKHLKILEKAGLVERKTLGREHWINANLQGVDLIEKWLNKLKSVWLLSLEQLENEIGNKHE
ncbi:MAG: metalloregulator ArsR/SmtB family transcription factor [Gammaproteobacteria bacterium]|nr:metalloregulator ArsR/SmtB family transcription factor [Gammaproteobacteria bacterium]NKB64101.1 metalloregulator ArsR/SmtB family transcription factor [Gammaproteobacteria bacterium]